jgi:hypothetical protein
MSLNVFNGSLMNDAIFKFKRYEDSSLVYTGIDKHQGEDIGGWDTVIKRSEYEALFYNQQSTMQAPEVAIVDLPEPVLEVVGDDDDEPEEDVAPAKIAKPARKSKASVPQPPPDFIHATYGIKTSPTPAPAPKAEKPKVDTSGIAVGVTVQHPKFGAGKVIDLRDGLITVAFEEGQKPFEFPGAFDNGFLKI